MFRVRRGSKVTCFLFFVSFLRLAINSTEMLRIPVADESSVTAVRGPSPLTIIRLMRTQSLTTADTNETETNQVTDEIYPSKTEQLDHP